MHNILIFGDSITQGAYDVEGGGWADRLKAHFYKRELETDSGLQLVFNLGISGETIEGVEKRYEIEIAARMKDTPVIIIADGMNDSRITIATGAVRVPINEFQSALGRIISNVSARKISTILVGLTAVDESRIDPVPWRPDTAYRNESVKQYDAAIARTAQSANVPYIPMYDLFEKQYDLLTDGLHPNSEGHRLMFERVREYLEKAKIL